MTNFERLKVMQALQLAFEATSSVKTDYMTIVSKQVQGALAIMRKEDRASQAGDIPDFGHPVGLPHP